MLENDPFIIFQIRCHRYGGYGSTSHGMSCSDTQFVCREFSENDTKATRINRTRTTNSSNTVCECVIEIFFNILNETIGLGKSAKYLLVSILFLEVGKLY